MEKYHDHDQDEREKLEKELEVNEQSGEMPADFKPDAETIATIQASEVGRVEIKEQQEKVEKSSIEDLQVNDHTRPKIEEVPLDKIDLSDSRVNSPADFEKKSFEEMRDGFEKLETVVKPAVENGADREYFKALDQNHTMNVKPGGYEEVYDAFYGTTSIKLGYDVEADRYDVINGFHRLHVAQVMNLDTVLGQVKRY